MNQIAENLLMNTPLDSSILICGLIRNGELCLEKSIDIINNSFKNFSQLEWLVIESDSNDLTLNVLDKISQNYNNFRYISNGSLKDHLPIRTERIAYCRNTYIREILTNERYSKIDYFIVADLDGVNNLLTAEAVLSCWSRSDWDVCTANQLNAYYDIWALRHPVWNPTDCWEQYKFMNKYIKSNFSLISTVISKMIEIPRNSNWIEVNSAFGGLAIYKRSCLINSQYAGVDKLGSEICEHVIFHEKLKADGGRIFINPNLINSDFNEHTINHASILNAMKISN